MLCSMGGSAGAELCRKSWIYELKLDGVRIVAHRQGDGVNLFYRSSRNATESYPEIVRALRQLPVKDVVLDGEVVSFDDTGRPSFQRLERRIGLEGANDIALAERDVPVAYVVFDILSMGDRDLRALPLTERRAILESIVPDRGLVRVLEYLRDDGRPLFEMCRREGLEGVIAKRADSAYRPGIRSDDWVKVKCQSDDDFVVVGLTRGTGGRDALGALDLATYAGESLIVRGKVGSGLDERTITAITRRAADLVIERSATTGEMPRAPRGRTFVKPEIVVNVRYGGWTDDGKLRHPVFRGVRHDVAPSDCTAAPTTVAEGTDDALSDYYASVASVLLPYLRGRKIVVAGSPAARVTTVNALRKLGAPLEIIAPDWIAFDTDAKGALALRRFLEEIGLTAYARTGERSAFQVLVPLGLDLPTNAAPAFAELVYGLLLPLRIVVAPVGPILAPYAPSARAIARVSAPLEWSEVTTDLEAASFTRVRMADRVARVGDPMAEIRSARIDFSAAVASLEARVNARR